MGGIYVGVVKTVAADGKVFVSIPKLGNTIGPLRVANSNINRPLLAGEQVLCAYTNMSNDEMYVLGYINARDVFTPTITNPLNGEIISYNGTEWVNSNVNGLISGFAPLAGPTFTGTVTLPSTTSIGTVSSTEIGYLDNVTSSIQTQLNANQTQLNAKAPLAGPTFTGTVTLPSTTSIGTVSSTELGYVDGVTSAIQTQLNTKAPLASPTFTGTVTLPSTVNASGAITANGVVTGSGGLVSNVFTTGVAYGSFGAVSLIGAGNNTYTGIANAHYSCAVMWNNTIFGHYRNNNTWNFYFESGTLNNSGNIVSGGNITAANGGQDGGFTLRPWTASSAYVSLASRDMSGAEYSVLTNGTDTFISGGAGGSSYVRAGNNDTSGQVQVAPSAVYVTGNMYLASASVNDSTDYVSRDSANGRIHVKSSNRALKENIAPVSGALDTIEKLSPKTFNWKLTEEDTGSEYKTLTKQTYKSMGFILEEVLDVSPGLITWRTNPEDGSIYPGYWKIDDFIALSIQGVKELNDKILVLESEIKALREQK